MIRRREPRPIYGIAKKSQPCVTTIPEDQDINTYLQLLQTVLSALATNNNKTAALESVQIIENRIDRVLNNGVNNS